MLLAPPGHHIGHERDPIPRMNDNPGAAMAVWLASEIMPASATTGTSVSWWTVLKALMTGSTPVGHRSAGDV
jgi:hypothetical protein